MSRKALKKDDLANEESNRFFAMYCDYARTLRAWLVAYGVGGPVLFLTQEHINSRVAESGQGSCIVYLFLTGMSLQVFISLVNKWANWYLYADDSAQPWFYRAASWISDKFWIDIACDVGSVATFTRATLKVLLIFA